MKPDKKIDVVALIRENEALETDRDALVRYIKGMDEFQSKDISHEELERIYDDISEATREEIEDENIYD